MYVTVLSQLLSDVDFHSSLPLPRPLKTDVVGLALFRRIFNFFWRISTFLQKSDDHNILLIAANHVVLSHRSTTV
jgi:hypothetical protein